MGCMLGMVLTYLGFLPPDRVDDKSAAEYNLEPGATLHLVLALRGGATSL